MSMSGVWARLRGSASREKTSKDDKASAAVKSLRRHTISSTGSRKSVSQLFGTMRSRSEFHTLPADGVEEIICEERTHYPVYDPNNPDHVSGSPDIGQENRSNASLKRRSWSPGKIGTVRQRLRSRSASRTRSTSPKKDRSALEVLADAIRASASLLYSDTSSKSDGSTKRGKSDNSDESNQTPPTPCSVKTIASKKSVHFRFGSSLEKRSTSSSSPIPIPSNTTPALPELTTTGTFQLEGLDIPNMITYNPHPPVTPVEEPPVPESITSRAGLKLCLDEIASNQDRLDSCPPTPTPAADLVLVDPFADIAAVSPVEKALEEYADGFSGKRHSSLSGEHRTYEDVSAENVATSANRVRTALVLVKPGCSSNVETDRDSALGSSDSASIQRPSFRHPSHASDDAQNAELADHLARLAEENCGNHESNMPEATSRRLRNLQNRALGLLQPDSKSASTLTLPSTCSTEDIDGSQGMSPLTSSKATEPLKKDGPEAICPQMDLPVETSLEIPTGRHSSLLLSPTTSASSPPRSTKVFKYRNTTDETNCPEAPDNFQFSWHAREAVESALGAQFGHKLHASTPSPANIPLPQTVLPLRFKAMLTDLEPAVWDPFQEPCFVVLAHKMLNRFPGDFRGLILREGVTRRLWTLFDLDTATQPPKAGLQFDHVSYQSFCADLRSATESLAQSPAGQPRLTMRQKLIEEKLDLGQRLALFDNDAVDAETEVIRARHLSTESFSTHVSSNEPPIARDAFNLEDSGNRYVNTDASIAGHPHATPLPAIDLPMARRHIASPVSTYSCAEICAGHHLTQHSEDNDQLPLLQHNFLRRHQLGTSATDASLD